MQLTETRPNIGIFQSSVDPGGFVYDVASGVTVRPTPMLKVGNEYDISVPCGGHHTFEQ